LTLDHFSFSLDSLSSDNACTHCGKNDQWVSHGYVYKKQSDTNRQVTGKRILCCNRYGRSGCGRTRQLYLAEVIPGRQYRLSVVVAFIQALLTGVQPEQAYRDAIGSITGDSRHAWRWLNDFFQSLSGWRTIASLSFGAKQEEAIMSRQRSRCLNIILPTLKKLATYLSTFQLQFQRAFF